MGNGEDLITAIRYFNSAHVDKGLYLFWSAPKNAEQGSAGRSYKMVSLAQQKVDWK